MRILAYVFFLMAILPFAQAAVIEGTVYDLSLDPADAVVEISTTPMQRMVAKEGVYQFTVLNGVYQITADAQVNGGDHAAENITIIDDGRYRLDLFLFPDLNGEDALDADAITLDALEEGSENWWWISSGVGLVIAIGVLWWWVKAARSSEPAQHRESGTNELLAILKAHDGRMTQKELRDKLPHSEAKVSLMLAELEAKGKIEKIKRGRANVLLLR